MSLYLTLYKEKSPPKCTRLSVSQSVSQSVSKQLLYNLRFLAADEEVMRRVDKRWA